MDNIGRTVTVLFKSSGLFNVDFFYCFFLILIYVKTKYSNKTYSKCCIIYFTGLLPYNFYFMANFLIVRHCLLYFLNLVQKILKIIKLFHIYKSEIT